MPSRRQRGSALIEAICSIAVLAMLGSAFAGAAIFGTRAAAAQTLHRALVDAADAQLRIALDVLKYRDASLAPASIATTIPMPGGSPLPVTLSLSATTKATGSVTVTIDIATTTGATAKASVTGELETRAPQPGSLIPLATLAPAPTGAP